MAVPIYGLWSDNLFAAATVSIVGGAESGPTVQATLTDGNPAYGQFFAEPSVQIVGDLGTAQKVALPCVFNDNFTPGLAVSHDSASSSGFSAPASTAFTVGALEADGYRPDLYLDLDVSGTAPVNRYHRLNVSGTNAKNLGIGQVFWGSTRRSFPVGFEMKGSPAYSVTQTPNVVEHLTYGDVSLRVNKGFRRTIIAGSLISTSSDCDAVLNFFLALGGMAQPLVLVPDPTQPFVMLCLIDLPSMTKTLVQGNIFRVAVTFRQLSRGLGFTW